MLQQLLVITPVQKPSMESKLKTLKQAYEINDETKTEFCANSIAALEMKTIQPCFNILDDCERPPPGYTFLPHHMVFDVKTNLCHKACLVANGSRTEPSATDCYAGVVSCETVRIMFTYAALHGMDIWARDITNAFIQAPTSIKVFIKCVPLCLQRT